MVHGGLERAFVSLFNFFDLLGQLHLELLLICCCGEPFNMLFLLRQFHPSYALVDSFIRLIVATLLVLGRLWVSVDVYIYAN